MMGSKCKTRLKGQAEQSQRANWVRYLDIGVVDEAKSQGRGMVGVQAELTMGGQIYKSGDE